MRILSWVSGTPAQKSINAFKILVAAALLIKTSASFPILDNESAIQSLCLVIGFISGFAILLGYATRLSAVAGACASVLLFLNPPSADWLSHNNQLLAICLAAIAIGNSLAGYRIVQALVFIIYMSGVFMKFDPAFLSGVRLQQLFMLRYGSSGLAFEGTSVAFFQASAIVTLLIEALIPLSLLFRRTRRAAIIGASIFHVVLSLVLPVSVFSLLMIAVLILFWPDSPRPAIDGQEVL